ncbi:MAG: M48 family metallopeptidase, partial [Bacteroidaceae bacterium]|nr:M48 family metallopeptidase [Bacteroidaceae bacterium]
QAKVILWNRTIQLAKRYGFKYKDLKIQTSKTRWGSCSVSNSINLSVYLMTIPSHLIDYVILHELCHTVHHDHSDAFWALMDKVTEGKATSLRQELKENYRTEL